MRDTVSDDIKYMYYYVTNPMFDELNHLEGLGSESH